MPHTDLKYQQIKSKPSKPGTSISDVRFEHHREALGIGEARPRLSWKIDTDQPGWQQLAYEVELIERNGHLLESSGRVESGESVLVPWPFAPLTSREYAHVRVRVWDSTDQPTEWSDQYSLETGLLESSAWSAKFITPGWEEDFTRPQPCPMFRREFTLSQDIIRARLYISSLGVYETQINGQRVGDLVMPPGWTSYAHRLRYQTFDVTSYLQLGRNCLGAILGDGWYRGRIGFGGGMRNLYGTHLALLAQLEIIYPDGSSDRIYTNSDWRASTGPILASDIYDGEIYDARLEQPGWSRPGFDDQKWGKVTELAEDLERLIAPVSPPVRRTEVIHPVAITCRPSGKFVLDFGQNLVGRLQITVHGLTGQTITLRHAEVLQDGELCTRPLRSAKATDTYTLRGDGTETWEPHFTFHGFRYAEVDGWPGELHPDDICAVVCHSDLERTGWFECSVPLLNRLHENVLWSMRGNFFDVPTDCPQRDERLGWAGDIQVFSPTASYLYDVSGFLQSWLADLATEQKEYRGVPFVIPCPIPQWNRPAAAWGDAAVIVPWVLYQRYGDLGLLRCQFESMRGWVDQIAEIAGDRYLWDKGFQYGDWLDPSAPPDRPGDAKTPAAIVATAYFARSAELVGRSAGLLGRTEDEGLYLDLARRVRAAFNREYVTQAGRMMSDATTAYSLAIEFALLDDDLQRQAAGKRLAALVRSSFFRISTGFVGTPLICDALCSTGHHEEALRLVTQTECPSWLYPVTMGATTIWERWDSLLPDGSINPGGMTSFNHYALGAVADWLHRTVGGLAPQDPGYRRLLIQPLIGGGITWAHARHVTPYGLAECHWSHTNGQMQVDITIPPNTTATVMLPGLKQEPISVGSGKYRWVYSLEIPIPARPHLSLDSTIDQLIDVPGLYTQVIDVFSQYNREIISLFQQHSDITIRQAIDLMPHNDKLCVMVEQVIADHNE